MSTTRLVLIRHGESAAQVGGFHAGHDHCKGLSDHGREQAKRLAARLEGGELGTVDVLYSSIMQRAVETASIIGPAIGHEEWIQDCGVCEIHPGEADGLTSAEVQERWPLGDAALWEAKEPVIGGSETWLTMHGRVRESLGRIAADHDGATVVIACHGGVIAHTMQWLLDIGPDNDAAAWMTAQNTSITEFVLDPTLVDWRKGRWGLVRYNDHAHLLGL